jgi:hypothetical protein
VEKLGLVLVVDGEELWPWTRGWDEALVDGYLRAAAA